MAERWGWLVRFRDIPQVTRDGNYAVDVGWVYLEKWIAEFNGKDGVDLNPDFQRAHVWTEVQQVRFVEFVLRRGVGSSELRFNCPTMGIASRLERVVIVDGKQRLEAVRRFMRDELAVFDGYTLSQFEGRLPLHARFHIRVNDLKTEAEVLQWYLDINSGGVAHTNEELDKVRGMLLETQCKESGDEV